MDKITKTLFDEFTTSQGLSALKESDAFEHFTNYSVLSNELTESFDLDDVAVGEGGNIGIDGIAVLVNGALVTCEEDAEALFKANGYLDVTFVFIQAKTSSSFDLGDMSTFFFAVGDFFSDTPKLAHTTPTRDLMLLKDFLYKHVSEMRNRNPNVDMYYVCTGKWTDDPTLKARASSAERELKDTQLFNEVSFKPVDARNIQDLYRSTKGKSTADFNLEFRISLPRSVPGVKEAHFGLVSAKDYVRIVSDINGNIKKSLFYDNVRDFQDMNLVNQGIAATIHSKNSSIFPLLNNGVTIIAREVRPTGNNFHIEDYQIVNGCQTSHVLHGERAKLSDEVFVPIRVISTEDEETVNQIIKATNSQTEVKPDQLYALSDFQKTLETYYTTFRGAQKLYYERRAKQYSGMGGVEKIRIVTIQQQIRAFVSMFLNEPHKGHYARSTGVSVGKAIFAKDHQLDPYYLSAYTLFKLESFFRNRSVSTQYKPARFHLVMAARHILDQTQVPEPRSREMKKLCDRLQSLIDDDAKLLTAFNDAIAIVDAALAGRTLDRAIAKTQPFTQEVTRKLLEKWPHATPKQKVG